MTTETQNGKAPPAEYTKEEQRRMAVLAGFQTKEALTALESLAEQVPNLEHAVTQAKLRVQLAEEQQQMRENEVYFEQKEAVSAGKNEAERKELREQALRADRLYQERGAAVIQARQAVAEAEHEARLARHRERFWQIYLEVRTAQTKYLAGG